MGEVVPFSLRIIHQGSKADSKRELGHQEKNSKGHLFDTAMMILETADQIVPHSPQSCESFDNSV